MKTKQIHVNRIVFLKEFTEEIIKNLSKKHDVLRRIRIEKLKKKFNINDSNNINEISANDAFKRIISHKIISKPRYQRKNINISLSQDIKKPIIRPLLRKPLLRSPPPKIHPVLSKRQIKDNENPKESIIQNIKPIISEKPKEFTLGKLNRIIRDPFVQSIECTGPGKYVLVKKYNKINLTKIILSQEEINTIIEEFSKNSKIPIIGGILKSAVGDLVISAIASKNVGSRFIISRINPGEEF